MKRYLFSIEVSLLAAVVAAVLVRALAPPEGENKPGVAVSNGQIIYSVNIATSRAVVTGYVVSASAQSPSPDKSGRRHERTAGSARQEPAPKAPKRPSRVNIKAETQKLRQSEAQGGELLNPYIIENLIKSSDKTYYFTEKSLTRNSVTVELLSMTPRKDDYFLKFRIVNSGKDYFIPQAFAVKHGNDWVDVEKFFPKYLVEGGQEFIGYLRVKTPYGAGAKERVFQLNESGGSFRKYSIFY